MNETSERITEEKEPFTLIDLEARLKDLNTSLSKISDKHKYEESKKQKQKKIIEWVGEQLKEKDRYKNIFFTEKGSVYFTLVTGESLRVKKNGDELKLQPICRKIVYVNKAQGADLSEMKQRFDFQKRIIGKPINIILCSIGAIPIEFSINHMPEIQFTESSSDLVINGDNMGVFASGYHQGHSIAKVVK